MCDASGKSVTFGVPTVPAANTGSDPKPLTNGCKPDGSAVPSGGLRHDHPEQLADPGLEPRAPEIDPEHVADSAGARRRGRLSR